MIAESAAMSKPRMGQVDIGRSGWLSGNGSAHALARYPAQQTGNCGDDDKPREKPGERAEVMVLERLSAA